MSLEFNIAIKLFKNIDVLTQFLLSVEYFMDIDIYANASFN